MSNGESQAGSKRLIRETIQSRGFFPSDLAAHLSPAEVMQPNDFSERVWTRLRVEECGDPVIRLNDSKKLITHSMYWDQRREGIEPILVGTDRIEGALERIYVRKKLADVLEKAASLLPDEYQLLVLDGFRPEQVQRNIFEKLQTLLGDEVFKYVSPPDQFASHATGAAVDLTILQSGKPVDMGGKVDEMGKRAHLHCFEGAKDPVYISIRDWRRYLQWLLKTPAILNDNYSDVVGIPTETWHLELVDTQVGAFTQNRSVARYGNASKNGLLPADMH